MSEILNKRIVLVLNRNWQAINITTPALAFCQMATDVATGLDIHGQDHMIPTRWPVTLLFPEPGGDSRLGAVSRQVKGVGGLERSGLPASWASDLDFVTFQERYSSEWTGFVPRATGY